MIENVKNTKNVERAPNPLVGASIWSRLMFSWVTDLLMFGRTNILEEKYLPHLAPEDKSSSNKELFEKLWREELERVEKYNKNKRKKQRKKKPSFHRALLFHVLTSLWYIQPFFLCEVSLQILQGVAIGFLIETFDDNSSQFEEQSIFNSGYFWAGVLILSSGSYTVLLHQHFLILWRKGNQLKAGAIAAIYSKSLKLHSIGGSDENEISSGKVVNLATNDAERFVVATLFLPYLFWAPVQALIVLVIGIRMLGPAFAAGYVVLFCLVPLQFFLGNKFAVLRSKVAKITDSRVTLVAQAISGVRVMKMSGWEHQFHDRITKLRKREMHQIHIANRYKSMNEAIFFFSNVTIAIIIFSVRVATGGSLIPRHVFTTMTLINIVQMNTTKFFALAVMGISECYVSISRLQQFFKFPELSDNSLSSKKHQMRNNDSSESQPFISLTNTTCVWGISESSSDTSDDESLAANIVALRDINTDFYSGKLHCIIGPVGCGKSALIQAVAGELLPIKGSIMRSYETLAYASQDAWVMNGSIKENIIMGRPFDPDWYKRVVASCGLLLDFGQFKHGDETIVGDRGVQCSGGQRARINLARALYRDAEVILLDDPLSAVDSKVGRLIFFSAIQELCVKRGKCVILATHQHQFIGDSTCIFMLNGEIKCIGSFSECMEKSNGKLLKITQTKDRSKDRSKDSTDEDDDNKENVDHSSKKATVTTPSKVKKADNDQEEMNTTGDVKWGVWLEYMHALGGVWVVFVLAILFISAQVAVLVSITVLGKWAEMSPLDQKSSSYMGLVLGLGALVIFLSIVRSYTTFFCTIRASQRLHDKMSWSVLRAKIEFFDTNPLGRILNRFSSDVGVNDDQLPATIYDFLVCLGIVSGGLFTSMSVLPITLLAVLPLIAYFIRLRRIFLSTSRELKRIDGISRSPIHAMLSESLSGIATIRINSAVDYFRQEFERTHDANIRAFFYFLACSRWLGFRLDSIIFSLTTVASLSAVLFNDQGWFDISPSVLGLALTLLIQLSGTFQWTVRQSAEVVNQMVSVERVSGFSCLPSEADLNTDADNDHPNWPEHGDIVISNLKARYRASLPPSLSDISVKIKSGQRVGIVGRTGCGKSTLVQTLFRILEAEEGVIKVDGIDISSLGLHKVRTEMSVIPQYPVLFSGCSIRENLDPFEKYDDETIINALKNVQMLETIQELPEGLDARVAEGGSNFSVGQRQLICLARAILRKNKILVLDEPTANVDGKTDYLLQKAVAEKFSESTIIAVAHRLDTIIDYDLIVVLGGGELLEIGSPNELLKVGGHFASMVDETGEETAKRLRDRVFKS